MNFLKSTLTSFLSNMFGTFVSLLTIIVTARILGTGGNGVWMIANTIIGSSMIVFGLGIPAANVYFIGKDRKNIDAVIGINILVMIISAVGAYLLFLLDLKFHFSFFKGLDKTALILVMTTVPFTIIKTSLYYVLLGIEEVIKYNKINMLDRTVTFVLLVIFIFVFRSAKWIIVSNFISVCVMVFIICYILFIQKKYKVKFNKIIFIEMMKYGFKAQMGNAIQFINYRLDVFVSNSYLSISAVGLYSKASQLGETMWKVSGSVGTVVLPYTANSKDKGSMTQFINKIIRVTFTFIICCALVLTLISKPLFIFVLGKKFAGSVMPFILIIPGISIFSINSIVGNYFAGAGMIGKNIIASAIASVITVVLDFTLIPKYGINGAAITSSISYSVCTIVSVYFYLKHTQSKLSDILILKKSDINEIKLKLYKIKASKKGI